MQKSGLPLTEPPGIWNLPYKDLCPHTGTVCAGSFFCKNFREAEARATEAAAKEIISKG